MTEWENVVPSRRNTRPLLGVPGLPHCTAEGSEGDGDSEGQTRYLGSLLERLLLYVYSHLYEHHSKGGKTKLLLLHCGDTLLVIHLWAGC